MDKKVQRNFLWIALLILGTIWILARHNRNTPYQMDNGLIFGTVYKITYQYEKDLKEETIVILGLIYRDFLADPEEREDLQLKDTEAIKKVEEELNQKYDMENVFNKRKTKKNVNNSPEEMGLTVYKERFIKKIFNLIKGIFKK